MGAKLWVLKGEVIGIWMHLHSHCLVHHQIRCFKRCRGASAGLQALLQNLHPPRMARRPYRELILRLAYIYYTRQCDYMLLIFRFFFTS
ncbi:hypothetical protein Lalb_Chr24g0396231 [Lupinus albus]|uniref:Uncharacterized protein n=1 Tax=Lupinus albus TaxID=3870 RepID=A0A6A4NAX7_LUPAL|nr:hypothetical protein Lalb_Chr24g0396231 [Lupinus albus]